MNTQKTLPTAWMWAEEGRVYGLSIDLETAKLRWFVDAGCLCDYDDSYADQTPAQFAAVGVPGGVSIPAQDILAEIEQSATRLAGKSDSFTVHH
jgi:hypothetical protein